MKLEGRQREIQQLVFVTPTLFSVYKAKPCPLLYQMTSEKCRNVISKDESYMEKRSKDTECAGN